MADLKTPLAFIGGLLTGAATTWVVSAKYFNKKIDGEIESIRTEFEAVKEDRIATLEYDLGTSRDEINRLNFELNKLISEQNTYVAPEEEPDEPVKPKKATKKNKSMEELESKPEPEDIMAGKTDYTAYSKGNTKKKADPDISVETPVKKPVNDPVIIDKKTFSSDDEYEKVLVTYYSNDDLYVDADGDICGPVVASQIGKNNISTLVRESDGVIYVRNATTMVDFKVILNTDPFCDEDEAEEED